MQPSSPFWKGKVSGEVPFFLKPLNPDAAPLRAMKRSASQTREAQRVMSPAKNLQQECQQDGSLYCPSLSETLTCLDSLSCTLLSLLDSDSLAWTRCTAPHTHTLDLRPPIPLALSTRPPTCPSRVAMPLQV